MSGRAERRGIPATDARSTSRLANDAWESLLTAHAAVLKRISRDDVWSEVSMREYDVLYTLAKSSGPVRARELTKHVLLSQPALSRLVDRLADRGLVAREPDPADRRGVLLSLTDDGRATQRRVGGRHAVDVAEVVGSRLTADELRVLENLCRGLATESVTQK
ncbi:MarR family transcriptional regulator [Gordonia pseudamarae]|jgi:DNA-binding MarR family transcriptional regulator|uniref:MarR family transcriptional regulator n=1 Tax=Gordonia pseudamarae TaxID=2831662 RepID=A0ABX6IC63_9ACTN|nr:MULTISPECIES: MarR family transcriptional regulator [Gordonia]MBD0024349.1 MarR family transcriptional regulator [Gordonia sp. (in: high G+C Gram-positive bacteria)]QHN24647.1 MarR family transcriptional regulator [Gordonia pseudamarae]QHN33577.1 MarR family transcriptional regulator [Gordonia pseudamarae]